MNWKRISATATPESIERLEGILWDAGAVSVTAQDGGDEPLLEPGPAETPLWREIVVTGLFRQDMDVTRVASALGEAEFSVLDIDELADRVWEREWLTRFRPAQFGRRLWVCPTQCTPPAEAQVVMFLDPGLAFGTGTHPTTRLCLEWLDGHVEEGMTVIDYGCGSGILGIAALLLGARSVIAVDNDPQALSATVSNATANGVAGKLEALLPAEVPEQPAELVIANILAQPLIDLAPRLVRLVAPGGRLVLSGIMQAQQQLVIDAYPNVRFNSPRVEEGWVCLSGVIQ